MVQIPALNVVHVSSEVAPYSQTGGLGMVLGALPLEQRKLGINASVISPLYRHICRDELKETGCHFQVHLGTHRNRVTVYQGVWEGLPIYFLDCPAAYDRDGLYGPRSTVDYHDNAWRFALLSRAALETCRRLRLHPDIMHSHDWQAGLLPFWCRTEGHGWIRTVHTIHNLGYQGMFPADTMEELGIDRQIFHPDGVEFWGWLSFLKAGLVFADQLTTVSPTYAEEVCTPRFGNGLDGVMRSRRDETVGILNGIDTSTWDPEALTPPIQAGVPAGRQAAEQRLRAEFGLEPGGQIACIISRLVSQKGMDLVPPASSTLLESGALRLIVIGTGDPSIEASLHLLQSSFPTRVALRAEYSTSLAQRVISGSSALLMPSRYEPCGLTQMIALRYGTLPIVRRTGGLADTVRDGENGFIFEEPTTTALHAALVRWINATKAYEAMRRRAMTTTYSWTSTAEQYVRLYNEVHERE